MTAWKWVAAAVAVALVVTLYARRLYARMSPTQTGIKNTPDGPEHKKRLRWLDKNRRKILAILKRQWPGVRMTSGYRNAAVNAAVGGVPTSYHQRGLAMDFGGIPSEEIDDAARLLRDHAGGLVGLRTVIAETTPKHLHTDFHDPLDSKNKRAARYLHEPHGGNDWRPLP